MAAFTDYRLRRFEALHWLARRGAWAVVALAGRNRSASAREVRGFELLTALELEDELERVGRPLRRGGLVRRAPELGPSSALDRRL